MKKSKAVQTTRSEKITKTIYFFVFVFFTFLFLYPIWWMLINSLKTSKEILQSPTALPTDWTNFGNYIRIFGDFRYKDYYYTDMLFNSLWITFVQIFVNLLSSVLLAYPIAKFRFPGRNLLYSLVIFANTIPIFGAATTKYKLMMSLNMIDNPFLIWLSWAGGFDFAFIVFYGTFKGISNSYLEAASIDGAKDFYILFRIVMPQAITSIVALAITQAIPAWNDYTTSMINLRSYPNLAYGLYCFQQESRYMTNSKAIYYSAAMISMIPPLLLYACNQKMILSNISAGGIKG